MGVAIGLLSLWSPVLAATSFQSMEDYPLVAMRAGHEGTAAFEVVVDEQGRAQSCRIVQSSGWPELDEATCRVVQRRARFNPARDAQGNPVKSTYSGKIRWRLPH